MNFDEAVEKAWHFLYGDGADPQIGQGFAILAVAYAIQQASELSPHRARKSEF